MVLRAGHSNLEQFPVTITVADIQERVSGTKSWTVLGPDTYWLKKLIACHKRLATQIKLLFMDETYPEWLARQS